MKLLFTVGMALLFAAGSALAQGQAGDPMQPGVDLGTQPLGYPTGVVGAAMARDRILRAELEALGLPYRSHAFLRGPDIVAKMDGGGIEAGLMGDMPTIAAIAGGDVVVVGIVKHSGSAVVSREAGLVEELRGERVAIVEGSSAHYTMLEALSNAKVAEQDVELVPMSIDAMPGALSRGEVAAFSGWEPAPAIALSQSPAHKVIYRGQSVDYFILSRRFAMAHPEAARVLIAGFVRAIRWMQQRRAHIVLAAGWTMSDSQQLTGKAPGASIDEAVRITRAELLDIPAVPMIPASARGAASLGNKARFLQQLGKVPTSLGEKDIEMAFEYYALREVLTDPKKYRLRNFDYDR